MAYRISYQMRVEFVADGAQALGLVPAQQTLLLGQIALQGLGLSTAPNQPTGFQFVPGGDSPSQSNFNTAIAAMATDLETAVGNNLGQIQGFATGGG